MVAAAANVIFSRGYRNCAVADITAEAKVSHGTFYNYFDSRREILDAVIDYKFDGLVVGVMGQDGLDGARSLNEFAEQFARMHVRLHRIVEREPELIRFVLFDAAAVDEDVISRLLGLFERIGELAVVFVRNGVERRFLRADLDVTIAADTVASVLSASALVVLGDLENGPELDPEVGAGAVAGYVDFVVHSLGADAELSALPA